MNAGQIQPEQLKDGHASRTCEAKGSRKSVARTCLLLTALILITGTIREAPLVAAEPASPVNEISLSFHPIAGGAALGGSGTGSATLDFGTVSAFGTVGAGITRTVSAGNLTVSSPFGVKVLLSSGASSSYTLDAALAMSDGTHSWQFGEFMLTTSLQTVAAGQPYGTVISHTLSLTVPFSTTASTINNSIEVLAVAD